MIDGPLGVAVASVFVVTTLLCAVSLTAHGPLRSRRLAAAEANHVVMGAAMVLMVAPATVGLVPAAVGAAAFAVAALAWGGTALVLWAHREAPGSVIGRDRCTGHPVHLLLVDAAMAAMYLLMLPTTVPAPAGTEHAGGMAGMDHAGGMAGAPTGVLVAAVLLAVYLVVHAVATVVVVTRRAPAPARALAPALAGETPLAGTGAAPVAVLAAPRALPRPVAALARGPVQLAGQAGMSLAMAAMLLLML